MERTLSLSNGRWWVVCDMPLGGYKWKPIEEVHNLGIPAKLLNSAVESYPPGPYKLTCCSAAADHPVSYELIHWGGATAG